jgi:hypothetical protein
MRKQWHVENGDQPDHIPYMHINPKTHIQIFHEYV